MLSTVIILQQRDLEKNTNTTDPKTSQLRLEKYLFVHLWAKHLSPNNHYHTAAPTVASAKPY